MVAAVGCYIRDRTTIPSGELYALVMESLTLSQYQAIVRTLERAGLIMNVNHMLIWIGPPSPDGAEVWIAEVKPKKGTDA